MKKLKNLFWYYYTWFRVRRWVRDFRQAAEYTLTTEPDEARRIITKWRWDACHMADKEMGDALLEVTKHIETLRARGITTIKPVNIWIPKP